MHRSSPGRSSFRTLRSDGCTLLSDEGPVLIEGRRSPISHRQCSPVYRKPSTLGWEITAEQQRAIERLADYPRRVERLRLLWVNIQEEEYRLERASGRDSRASLGRSGSRSSLGRSGSNSLPRRRSGSGGVIVPGALTARQIRELMSRELTPEDYELLCLLDEGIKKSKTLSPDVAAALPRATGTAWINEACGICLCALEEDEDIRRLPVCAHCFHAHCAERWLTVEKATCPLCGQEETTQEKVMNAFRKFDGDGDGVFHVEEMKEVLVALGGDQWSSGDVDKMFVGMDVNKDGKIVVEEFVNWVFATDETGVQQRLREAMDI